MENIRNFCIIAHIDHGKSTLADRFLEITGTIPPQKMKEQVLDSMDLEREKGITIKMHPVRMEWKGYILNLIDTPGHVDFTYEVSRSLAAAEGAILLVDASQGVEAQTVSNLYLALEQGLEIIPVINKIDLPNADIEKTEKQIKELLGDTGEIYKVSAKKGWGVEEVLKAVIEKIPSPKGEIHRPLRALIFDAVFDEYKGVIPYIRIFDGKIRPGDKVYFKSTGEKYEVVEVGYFTPNMKKAEELKAGEVGYIVCGMRDIDKARVGDTIVSDLEVPALPGYREPKPFIFAGFYPILPADYEKLTKALQKLKLNDASLFFSPEYSPALGPGFRCGFLGLLHMEIVKERLKREFGLDLVITVPQVKYKVVLRNGEEREVKSPKDFPDIYLKVYEPFVRMEILTPKEFIGSLMKLCEERRGKQINFQFLDENTAILEYEIPLSEILFDFYDKLKSFSRGYASMDYEIIGYREADVVKLDILVMGQKVDALSVIVPRQKAYYVGREMTQKLRKLIPRQLFEVSIQAAIGKKVISKERIPPLRKDVTAKCYGGDITRKMKLLEKQKEGKKRMKKIGRVEVPPEAFAVLLSVEKKGG